RRLQRAAHAGNAERDHGRAYQGREVLSLLRGREMFERKVLDWFVNGRVGISSRAMAAAAIGIKNARDTWDNHPHDPDDLNRCLLLLVSVPEIREAFDKVAAISPVWAALIERWSEIEQCFLDEAGL